MHRTEPSALNELSVFSGKNHRIEELESFARKMAPMVNHLDAAVKKIEHVLTTAGRDIVNLTQKVDGLSRDELGGTRLLERLKAHETKQHAEILAVAARFEKDTAAITSRFDRWGNTLEEQIENSRIALNESIRTKILVQTLEKELRQMQRAKTADGQVLYNPPPDDE